MKLSREQAKMLGVDLATKPHRNNSLFKNKGKARALDGIEGRDKLFDKLCVAHGLPVPVHEYRFCEGRKWRFDYLFDAWLAVEKVGGVWIKGHHSRGKDQIDDMEKFNEAVILGFSVLQFTPEQFDSGLAFAVIKRALEAHS
jgi:hypothetical protein